MKLSGVDVGGTFTDAVTYDTATERIRVFKTLTTSNPESAVVSALAGSTEVPSAISMVTHATTMATNALLTGAGLAKTALVTNRGFRDVLEIARQRRPEVYDLRTARPPPLVRRAHRFGVAGRMRSDGSMVEEFDKEAAETLSKKLARQGFEAVAVCFLNSYADPKQELKMLEALRRSGFGGFVSLSHEVDRAYREYERTSTTVVNAALSKVFSDYLTRLADALRQSGVGAPVYFMTSDGGMTTSGYAKTHPVSVIESGPAAGVLASAHLARRLKKGKVLTFDMGGTTAKAGAVVHGQPAHTTEFEAAGRTHSGRSIKGSGYVVRGPLVDLAEVSAGGGTIAWIDEGGSLVVGPKSAGSDPGPACYSRGGADATVTDANVVLGRINPRGLLGGRLKIDTSLAARALGKLASSLGTDAEEAAKGVVRLVNSHMAKAMLIVSVERGFDPREFTLVAFGGAGPIHCCDLAEDLGVREIVVPSHPGLFSAYGLLVADLARNFVVPVTHGLDEAFEELRRLSFASMESEGFRKYRTRSFVEARYSGQSHELTLDYRPGRDLKKQFDGLHRTLYGFSSSDPVEVVNARLRAIVSRPRSISLEGTAGGGGKPTGPAKRRVWLSERWYLAPVFWKEAVTGRSGSGPCVIEEYDSTIVVNPTWEWSVKGEFVRLTR